MIKYLKECENFMCQILNLKDNNTEIESIKNNFKTQIEFLQHERLIHLVVTLSFALFLLLSVFFTIISKINEFIYLDLLLFILLIPYIAHYYKLENGVQRLYKLYERLNQTKNS